jgi:hypothetical protein
MKSALTYISRHDVELAGPDLGPIRLMLGNGA